VASALDAAHGAGLVHRDVKPANMLVDVGPGRADHVYLSDFGLTKKTTAASAGLTGRGQILGTPDYIAPERIQGRPADGRTDQYALACAAFELLTGAPPFRREETIAAVYAHVSDPPPPATSRRADLPPGLDPVLARALAKEPADRYPSCQAFADALLQAVGTAPPRSRPPASQEPAPDHPPTQIDPVSGRPGRPDVPAASTASPPHAHSGPPNQDAGIPAPPTAADEAGGSHGGQVPAAGGFRTVPQTPAQPATAALSAQTQSAAPVRDLEDTATAVGAMAGGQTGGTDTVKPGDAVSIGDGDSAAPDSDGAAATIHLQGRAVSMPPAPPKAATSHAEAASEAARRTQPEPRQDTALPQGSAAPAPDAASGEAATASLPHAARQRRGGSQVRSTSRLLVAGGLAVLGAVLTIVALFPTFTGQVRLITLSANRSEAIIRASVALGAGICIFVPGTRRLIGPGLLLGGLATAPSWAAYDLIVAHAYPPAGAGMWLHLLGMAVWLLACCLVLLSLAQAREVRLRRQLPRGVIAWLVTLVGVAGAVALVLQVEGGHAIPGRGGQGFVPSQDLAPLIWAAAMALVIPAAAALALPRQFGIALLAGWICDGAAMVAFYTGPPGGVFGFTLLALAMLIIPFSGVARPSGARRRARDSKP